MPDPKPRIKPLKRTLIDLSEKLGWGSGEILRKRVQTQRVKNPRWASLSFEIEVDKSFENLKILSKYRSLHLTSIEFTGMQIGASVGHFNGEIRHLVKSSRYLRKLHFKAGVVLKKRFLEVKHWITGQKNIKDLSIVPYWYNQEDEEEIEEWGPQETRGVSDLLYKLSAQLRRLTIVGIQQLSFAKEFYFSRMRRVETFCVQAASWPKVCAGKPIEFSKIDLKIIEKILMLKSLKRLVLANECETTSTRLWTSFSKLIAKVTRSLIIDVEIKHKYSEPQTCLVLKHHLKMLQPNVKFSYKVSDSKYFLYLPEGKEIIGDDGDFSEDKFKYEEGEEEDDDH